MNVVLQAVVGRDHGRWAFVDGVNDLGVVDPAEVAGGDCQIGVSELSLNHDQRDSLSRHLDRMGVTQLMRRESAPHSGR